MGRHTAPVPIQPEPSRPDREARVGRHTAPVPVQRAEQPEQRPHVGRHTAPVPVQPQRHEAASPRHPAAVPSRAAVPLHAPREARGTLAAAPATGPVPIIAAPSLHTGPVPLTEQAPRARRTAFGRWVAVAAGLIVAGSVAAQFTAQRSLADAPLPVSASSSAGSPSGSDSASAADSVSASSATTAPTPAVSGPSPSPSDDDADPGWDGYDDAPLPVPSTEPGDPTAEPSDDPSEPGDADSPSATPTRTAKPTKSPKPTRSPSPTSDPAPTGSTDPSDSPSPSEDPTPSEDPAPTPSGTTSEAPVEGSDLRAAIRRTDQGAMLQVAAGTYTLRDFGSDLNAADLERRGLKGAGSDRTVVQLAKRSSSKAGAVPTKAYSTNQLYVLSTIGGTPGLSGFTVRATEQGHLFNGLRIGKATNARVTDVRVEDVPGDKSSPPGETFALNDWRTTGSVYRRITIDSGGVGAAGFGTNSSRDVTIEDSTFTGTKSSSGAAIWQTKDITMTDVKIVGNRSGINFERSGGRIVLNRPVFRDNRLYDMQFGTDLEGGTVVINDPVLAKGQKLVLNVPAKYHGHVNGQKRANIKVLVDGVDRTDELIRYR